MSEHERKMPELEKMLGILKAHKFTPEEIEELNKVVNAPVPEWLKRKQLTWEELNKPMDI